MVYIIFKCALQFNYSNKVVLPLLYTVYHLIQNYLKSDWLRVVQCLVNVDSAKIHVCTVRVSILGLLWKWPYKLVTCVMINNIILIFLCKSSHHPMKTSSKAVEMSQSTSQSDFIVRQTIKRSSSNKTILKSKN